jgi:hypothetical protein
VLCGGNIPALGVKRRPDQRVAGFKLNVAVRDMVIATVGKAAAEFGASDIVITMSGIGGAGELASMKFERGRIAPRGAARAQGPRRSLKKLAKYERLR